MMLSLLETIVLMYLIEKDSAPRDNETNRSLRDKCHQGKDNYNNCPEGETRGNEAVKSWCNVIQNNRNYLCVHLKFLLFFILVNYIVFSEMHSWTQCSSICDGAGETPSELLSVANEVGGALESDCTKCSRHKMLDDKHTIDRLNKSTEPLLQRQSRKLVEDERVLEKVSDELREMEKTLSLILSSRRDEVQPGYWSSVATRVNKVFFIFYVLVITVFLFCLFLIWKPE